MVAFLSIGIYSVISAMFVAIIGRGKFNEESAFNGIGKRKRSSRRQIFLVAVLFAVLYTLYNVYCTKTSVSMGGDRLNYSYQFDGYQSTSIGLTVVFKIVKFFGGNIYNVFYLTTFLYVFTCVYVLIGTPGNNKAALVFFVLTDAIFFSFTALKQIYACTFSSICFLLLTRKKSAKRSIACWCAILLACLFHDAAIIIVPVYLAALFIERGKKSFKIKFVLVVLFAAFVFLDKIALLCSNLVSPFAPSVAVKIREYFFSSRYGVESSPMAFIKGFPFYVIFIWGLVKRKSLVKEIEKYDFYLLLSAVGAVLFLSSVYSYWMYRAVAFFYIPIAIFCGKLRERLHGGERMIFGVLVYLSMFVVLLRWIILIYVNYGGF